MNYKIGMVILHILFYVSIFAFFPLAIVLRNVIKEETQKHWEDYVSGRIDKL